MLVKVLGLGLKRSVVPVLSVSPVSAIGATVMLGVLLFVASYDSFRNVQASYDRTYARTHFADLTVTGGDSDAIAAAVRSTCQR